MKSETIPNPHAMATAGAEMAKNSSAGTVIALVGGLGSGKTCFSTGFIKQLIPAANPSSPTFSIVHEHRANPTPIFHFDLYRLKSEEEALALGWDEYLEQNAIILCEWANLYPKLFPPETLWITITHVPDVPSARTLTVSQQTPTI